MGDCPAGGDGIGIMVRLFDGFQGLGADWRPFHQEVSLSDQTDNINFAEIVNRICKAGNPLQVVLFGSRSRGDARQDSDIDLLIIEESTEPRYKRAAKYLRALLGISPGKDVVVWTPKEVAEWARLPNTFIATALREGRVLYER